MNDEATSDKVNPTLLANIENFLNFFDDKFEGVSIETLEKFIQIKEIIESKTLDVQQLHDKIKELLDISEMYDLLRMERWPNGVVCIYCNHDKVIKLGKFLNKNKYLCEKCHMEFFDDSDTPIEPDRVVIAIMLHLLLSSASKTEIVNFLRTVYGFRKEYLDKLIPELKQETLLGDQAILRFLSFTGLEHITANEFRKNLTSGTLHAATIGHTRRSSPNKRSR
jgi:transposase-like protein